MSIWSVRPKLNQLIYVVYARPLHPELFDIQHVFRMAREHHEFTLWMTESGHVVTWRHGELWLTEVLTAADRPLPKARRMLSFRLRDERTETFQCANVVFQLSCSVEQLTPELFHRVADELEQDARRSGRIACRFPALDRLHPSALSYVAPEAKSHRLLVYSYHTFPEEYGIVKTQTVYEILDD